MYPSIEDIVSLCKRRGFVYQSADIYGGITGLYDYGHYGVLLKRNLQRAWEHSLATNNDFKVVFLDGAQIGPEALWKASGHADHFSDPMVDCTICKHRYRADEIDMTKGCPHCGNHSWTEPRQFNMMFSTSVGAQEDSTSKAYLRPETAQTIFANFKNIVTTLRVKVPFGVAQVGKAFRNEVTPKQFLFRMREFEQMELEFFCRPEKATAYLKYWTEHQYSLLESIGINTKKLRIRPHEADELAHYSSSCNDIEYQFPFGWKELEGIAHRGDYDLSKHSAASGKELRIHDQESGNSYIPHVVESSIGLDRLFLTVLFDAYTIDEIDGSERTVLSLHPAIAPITAAVLPLTKKLNDQALPIFHALIQAGVSVEFDQAGSIGKRYRRQDEIGTPFCITVDFESRDNHTVTVRHRDTATQERIPADQLIDYILKNRAF